MSCPTCKTRFHESKSWPLELTTRLVTFDDQRITFCPFNIIRVPSSNIVRTLEESLRGFSLIDTHMTVQTDTLLYHIPRYRLVEFTGLKNPSLKALPLEIMLKCNFQSSKWVPKFHSGDNK